MLLPKVKLLCLWAIGILGSSLAAKVQYKEANNDLEAKHQHAPLITVVFIVDQLSHDMLAKHSSNLRYGIGRLWRQGINYHMANHPQAMPTTPTGHACISTGALGREHGITSYGWLDEKTQNYIKCTQDDRPESAVISPDGYYDFGRSCYRMMTDTLADQFILSQAGPTERIVAAFALKSRASVLLAGRCGQAYWFDDKAGSMTSSRFYMEQLPNWLQRYNQTHPLTQGRKLRWRPMYRKDSKKYKFFGATDERFCSTQPKLFNKYCIEIDRNLNQPFAEFSRSPWASQTLLQTARAFCVAHRNKRILLYVSLSNFDHSAHLLGPDHRQQIDMLYHIDRQIGNFMRFVKQTFGASKSLFVLTSDHGASVIPEIQQERNFTLAERIDAKILIEEINQIIEERFNQPKIVHHFEAPQIFLDPKIMANLSKEKREQILNTIKSTIKSKPYIKECWTQQDLVNGQTTDNVDPHKAAFYNQAFEGRLGDIIYLTQPHKMVSMYAQGTSHCTPYLCDVHVPLILYQKGWLQNRHCHQPVCISQLAGSLARLTGSRLPNTANRKPLLGL